MAKGPFKMKGFSGFGNSPVKDIKGEDSYGGSLTKDKDGNLTTASKRIKELREKHNQKHNLGEWDNDHVTTKQ